MDADTTKLQRVTEALERLPPLCKRAFILVRFEGLNFNQAAEQMNMKPRKIRRFVARAFASCQRSIGH